MRSTTSDGRLEVFGITSQGHVLHTWHKTANGGWVGHWSKLYSDSDTLKTLRVAHNKDGRLEVFGVNALGHILHTWEV